VNLFDHPIALAVGTALVLAATLEVSHRVGTRFGTQDQAEWKDQIASIRDSFFVMTSLFLGFTLALVATRFADRQSLLVEEAAAIRTTYERAGLINEQYRERARALLRQYVDYRLIYDREIFGTPRFNDAVQQSSRITRLLWEDAENISHDDRTAVTATYFTSINQLIEVGEKRVAARENRIPLELWILLALVSILTVLARGLTLKNRFWINLVLVPLTIAMVISLIADLDAPTTGFIRIEDYAMQRLKADLG
jgi:hypothetical protein